MDRLRIVGGQRLQGSVSIAGAKNAALPQTVSYTHLTLPTTPYV